VQERAPRSGHVGADPRVRPGPTPGPAPTGRARRA
jgi:hypothetical protein